MQAAIAAAVAAFGGLDAVVNCAGIYPTGKRLEDVSDAEWDRTIAVNLTAMFRVCRATLPLLRAAGGGSIVNIASVHAVSTVSGVPAYATSKAAIVGLSRFNTNAHLARATLEAICYQSRDVVDAMTADSGVRLEALKVDGGVTANELCMQIQADVLGVPVSRPVVPETTALGAAYAAGLSVGFWRSTDELRANWREDRRWTPGWDDERRDAGYAQWHKAVQRTLDWMEI